MPQVYIHYYGTESSKSLLEARGIIQQGKEKAISTRSKQCPSCGESNKPDSKFCAKCRMVLKYDAYSETLEKQQQKECEVQRLQEKYDADIALLKEAMLDMQQLLKNPEKLAEISRATKSEISL
ncbi:MAG: zinc ribbon domain-containing protein [Candidatus Nitrosopolaris sp.]